jgi:5-methylcytosine-specific restriction endonuclease McrA
MDAPCGICKGKLGPIHYDEPSDSKHPLSFVIDEIKPVSKWKQFGYSSPAQAAQDWSNLQAAHYCCNQAKSNHVEGEKVVRISRKINSDGAW